MVASVLVVVVDGVKATIVPLWPTANTSSELVSVPSTPKNVLLVGTVDGATCTAHAAVVLSQRASVALAPTAQTKVCPLTFSAVTPSRSAAVPVNVIGAHVAPAFA